MKEGHVKLVIHWNNKYAIDISKTLYLLIEKQNIINHTTCLMNKSSRNEYLIPCTLKAVMKSTSRAVS